MRGRKYSTRDNDYDFPSLNGKPTHIDGELLCSCGKPSKCYHPICEDCFADGILSATKVNKRGLVHTVHCDS